MHQRRAPLLANVAIDRVRAELLDGWCTRRQLADQCGVSLQRVSWCLRDLARRQYVFCRWTADRALREYRLFPEAIGVRKG